MSALLYPPAVTVTRFTCQVRDDGTVTILLDPDGAGYIVIDDTDTSAALMDAAVDAHRALVARQRGELQAYLAQRAYEAPPGASDTSEHPGVPGDGGEHGDGQPALPAEAPLYEPACDARDGNWTCTAYPGHDGLHVAHHPDGITASHTWPQEVTA